MTDIKLELDAEELLACRICLATEAKLFGIYEDRLDEAFTDILGTNLSPGDGLPQRVCRACREQLRHSAGLRARARRADTALRRALAKQHYLTNDFIRSFDRIAHGLAHDDKSEIFTDYPHAKIIEPEPNDSCQPASCESDSDRDADVKSDIDDLASRNSTVEMVENNIAEVKILEDVEQVKIVEKEVKKECKKRKSKEKKKVIKVKGKPEVEWVVKKKPVRKKKGFKRYFMCDEDYIKFEEKYNIQVIRLSEEEQRREMEARKHTDSYLNALVRCEKCYKGFLSMFTYENHLKVHDAAVSGANECALCGCRFKWPNNLRTHTIESHQLKYVCKQCQRVVKGRHEALLHAEFHAGKTWECRHCGRTFKKKSTFYTHVRMNHAAEGQGEGEGGRCGACGATFKGAPGLKLHQIKKCNKNMEPRQPGSEAGSEPPTLSTRKGFICEVCGKKCTSLSILAVHLRAHTGDRPHACPGCPLRFAKKDNMEKHHRVVHLGQRPQVKCEMCGKLLAHAASLKLHVRTVHLKLPAPPRAPRPPRHRKRKINDMEG